MPEFITRSAHYQEWSAGRGIVEGMTQIHIVCGGISGEREVSLRSGAAVADALRTKGYDVSVFDTSDDPEAIVACDVVFPVLHGVGGEDGSIQAMLDAHGVRYVGSDVAASQLCFDKDRYRQMLEDAGLPIAQGALVSEEQYKTHAISQNPHVLKPVDGGSSLDTLIIREGMTADADVIRGIFSRHREMLLEELIVGDELTVGVLGDEALPVIEIIPPKDGEFDYENKYNGQSQELCPPVHVSQEVQKHAQELALAAHQLTGCRDYSRTDIMYDRKRNAYFILETNTIPGMTAQSLFPKMAATAGVDMPTLCDQLVSYALNRPATEKYPS